MLYDIKVRFFNNKTQRVEESTVSNYGIVQAIDEVRFNHSFKIMILSANFVVEETLINNLKV